MEGRYSYEKEGPARCQLCDGYVHEKATFGQMSAADVTPPIEIKRICQNPRCLSNTGETSLADMV